jgi:hypothetical protein
MSLLQAVGLTILPNIGGIVGGLSTRAEIKNWYEVNTRNNFYKIYF